MSVILGILAVVAGIVGLYLFLHLWAWVLGAMGGTMVAATQCAAQEGGGTIWKVIGFIFVVGLLAKACAGCF